MVVSEAVSSPLGQAVMHVGFLSVVETWMRKKARWPFRSLSVTPSLASSAWCCRFFASTAPRLMPSESE